MFTKEIEPKNGITEGCSDMQMGTWKRKCLTGYYMEDD